MNRPITFLSAALLLAGTSVSALAQTQNMQNTQHQNPTQPSTQNAPQTPTSSPSTQGPGPNGASQSSMENPSANANTSNSGAAENNLSREEVRQAQAALKKTGENVKVDGIVGPQTQEAVRNFQQKNGIEASGQLDQQTLQKLNVSGNNG